VTVPRPALPADAARLVPFLEGHLAGSMFPLGAVLRGDLIAPGAALPSFYAMHGWLAEADTDVTAFLGLTQGGTLLPQGPGADWAAFRPQLAGRVVAAAVGPAAQVPLLLEGLGLAACPRRSDKDEPGFDLWLDRLVMPDVTGFRLQPLTRALLPLVTTWRALYLQELQALPPDAAQTRADEDVWRWLLAGDHRLLVQGEEPVAMCGFNARLPEVVQVGAVFTPPALRGRGHARRAVALHLAEARATGLRRAVLFAASEAAATAYRAIGFQPQGRMAIVEFATPATVAA
jgi:RimJ/RimL family protein N-acetyltransferase